MCYAHLTSSQRYQIERLMQDGQPVRGIARKLGVHRSTVYRELARGRCRRAAYHADRAQARAQQRARRSAANHPSKPASLWRTIHRLLRRDWSPEQVRGWLHRFAQPAASVPAIYAAVRRDRDRGGRLYEHLRFGHRRFAWGRHSRGVLSRPRPSIHDRPASVQTRQAPGHWEGDTLTGASRVHKLLALVERQSRFLCLRRPASPLGSSLGLAKTLIRTLRRSLTRSLTFDNGPEFARYPDIQQALGCRIYFADPYHPWPRGTCENTIGLIRQYIPKGSSGRHLTTTELKLIADKLNHRPRKCLAFKTPFEVFFNKPPVALRT